MFNRMFNRMFYNRVFYLSPQLVTHESPRIKEVSDAAELCQTD